MRVAELTLERYGRFEDHRLTFPRREQDFHLVYGPNEAGKTTTLAALADLLFGFQHRVAYDYRFPASLLRVGAIFEQKTRRFACRRRRGRAGGGLVDANDAPLDEGPLRAMLHGQTRESFLQSSSLDHERLRLGGRAMAESKDDLGEMLFAASSGVTNLREVIAALDEELDGVWARRAADRRSFTRAERAWTAARAAVKEAAVKPGEWSRARDAVDRLRDQYAAAGQERQSAAAALAEAERLRRVLAPLTQRRAFTKALAEFGALAVPETIDLAAREALTAAADATRKRDTAKALLDDDLAKLASEPDDSRTLEIADRIDALVQGVKAETDRREQLPAREESLKGLQASAIIAAEKVGVALAADLTAPIPDASDLARLGDLVKRRVELQTLAESARTTLEAAKAAANAAAEALAGGQAPEGFDRLSLAIDAAKRAGDLDAAVDVKRKALLRARDQQSLLLAALAPWNGDFAALARLVPPVEATIDAAKENWASAERELADAQRAVSDRTDALALAEAQVQTLIDGEGVIPLERLKTARATRDKTLGRVRAHLLEEHRLDDPLAAIDRLVGEIGLTDDLADSRFAAADAAARLAQAQAGVKEALLKRDQSARHHAEALKKFEAERAAWRAALKSAKLPSLSPGELRDWLRRRADALAAHAAQVEIEDALEHAERARRTVLQMLSEAAGAPDPPPHLALAPTLNRAEAHLTDLHARSRAYEERKRAATDAGKRLEEASRSLWQAERELDGWGAQWAAEIDAAGLTLAPDVAQARLPVFEALRGALKQARDYRDRIHAMMRDSARFAADAMEIAAALGLPTSDPLEIVRAAKARIETARKNSVRRLTLEESVQARRDAIRAAEVALAAADATLADAFTLTGAADRTALAAALDAAGRRRALEKELAILGRELLDHADGAPLEALEAACTDLSAEDLAARANALRQHTEAATKAWEEIGRQLTEATSELRRLDTEGAASAAAADLEAARAEIEAIAETYLLKRSQRILLDHAVKLQAERDRNPLLKRAADLFRTLTLDRYSDLRVDHETDKRRLLGVCADGATVVQVADMSEGAQDQLFLALRLAVIERAPAGDAKLPFFADDLFVAFDDDRARAGLAVLGELSRTTQVLFFTHHAHLRRLAQDVFPELSVHDLGEVA